MDKRAPAKSQQFENRVFLGLLSAGSLSVATYFCLNLVPTFAYQSYVAVFSAFFVLLLSSLIIKRLLVHPIDAYTLDIEQLIEALPLLAKKKYEDARSMCVLPPDDERFFNAHNLRTTLFDLTSVLEELDSKVSQRNKAVFKAHQALKEERDFITQLVDSAQMLIITTGPTHHVQLFNHFGEVLTGFSKEEVEGSEVARFFPAGNWLQTDTIFKELFLGNITTAHQEAEFVDKAGQLKQIAWFHSRVEKSDSETIVLSVGVDTTETREAEKRIVWMAEHDPLTDLCNRRKFAEEFEKSIQNAIRYQHTNSLIILDLDRFKDINDTSGHRAGDEALKLVAKTLVRITRFTDLVARLSGDEFAIIMPETDQKGAITLAKKILSELTSIHLNYESIRHTISASIGIISYPLKDATANEIMGYADLAMYKAKSLGKSRYHCYSLDDQSRQQLEQRVVWKQKIEDALENHLFVLFYQPILDMQDNQIRHYEVLIRMRDPISGEITLPGKFIEIAEQVGLIQQIDHYVLHHSIKKLAALQKQGNTCKLAINLSGAVVDTPVLLPYIKRLIKQFDVDPTAIIFEVTETVAVANLHQAKLMMTAIKALGCRFSLDDFGVGFASFNYMRELPIDIIKIDGIFVRHLDHNADDQLFVKALIDVAKGLGKKTVAEYVENAEILEILREYGVDYAQGFYIGRPKESLIEKGSL